MIEKLPITSGMVQAFQRRANETCGGDLDLYALSLLRQLHESFGRGDFTYQPMMALFQHRLLAALHREEELREADRLWPKWASEILEILCDESGFEPQSDDEIDLPELLREHLQELDGHINGLRSLDARDARIAERTDSEIRRLRRRISEIGKQFRSLYMEHNDLLEKMKNG